MVNFEILQENHDKKGKLGNKLQHAHFASFLHKNHIKMDENESTTFALPI